MPGVGSHAKLAGRATIDFAETLELDLEFVRSQSLVGDFSILTPMVKRTVARSAGSGNADHPFSGTLTT